MEELLTGLNKNQYEAVITTDGPVMVMAGAGSGKTRVLTTRIAFLIDVLGVDPSNILAVTFTNKAANEMKERISNMIKIPTKNMWISTFHAFCSRLLRFEMNFMPPYTNRFNIIDDDDSLKIIRDIMKEHEINYKPSQIYKLISKLKNGQAINWFHDNKLQEVTIEVKDLYDNYLKNNNLLDFDDLIEKTIELFKKNPNILEKYQEKFKYILVDEFQDTNKIQYKLIKLLAAKYNNIFVVGDDFQSIYSFRGAQIENINKFREDYLNHKLILLEENYRSTPDILNLANNVIEHNKNQIKKVMFSSKDKYTLPVLYEATNGFNEAEYVIDNIKKLLLEGAKFSDFAIMYRNNSSSRLFENKLMQANLPYVIYGGVSFYQRKEIKDIVAYLKLIINYDDDFSFERIVNEPKRNIGNVILGKLKEIKEEKNISLLEAIDYYVGSGKGYTNLKNFKNVITTIRNSLELYKLSDLIDILDKEIGYIDEIYRVEDEEIADERKENILEFKSQLKELEDSDVGSNYDLLNDLLLDLSLKTNNDNTNDGNKIILTTYHQAKGLEFENVFMVSNEEGIFPSFYTGQENPNEMEEERRIFYVGVTRAKKRLFLTYADEKIVHGHKDYYYRSSFIDELDKNLYEDYNRRMKNKYNNIYSKPLFKINKEEPKDEPIVSSKEDLKVGDKVNHDKYGDGIIVNITDTIATIAFSIEYGVKKIKSDYQGLKKK